MGPLHTSAGLTPSLPQTAILNHKKPVPSPIGVATSPISITLFTRVHAHAVCGHSGTPQRHYDRFGYSICGSMSVCASCRRFPRPLPAHDLYTRSHQSCTHICSLCYSLTTLPLYSHLAIPFTSIAIPLSHTCLAQNSLVACRLPRVKGRASLLGLQAMLNHLFVDHGFRQYFSAALQQGTQPQEANTASQGVPPPALVEAGAAAGVCRYQLQFSRNTVRNLHRAK
jgi:hypothetical protein